jgi:hypothetical protein
MWIPETGLTGHLRIKVEQSLRASAFEPDDSKPKLRLLLLRPPRECFRGRRSAESFNIEPSLFAFGNITGVVPPTHDEASRLPFHLEMLYRTLIVEQISPLRIILGYGGYASEFSFRQAFVRFLKKGLSRNGFGAGSLPHLVICGRSSDAQSDLVVHIGIDRDFIPL